MSYVATAIGEIREGLRVRLKAGTDVRSADPKKRSYVMQRKQEVDIYRVWPPSPESPNGTILWVSQKNFLCAAYVDAIDEIVGG